MRIVREYDKEEYSKNGNNMVAKLMLDVLERYGAKLYIHTDSVTDKIRIVVSDGRKEDETV